MTVFSDHTIELSHLTFHCRRTGDPDAPPAVLLHGLMYDARDWDETAGFLAEHYHVLALTQRGHGESAWPGEYSFELGCGDLEAFTDVLSLDRFTLIGHSMGARVGCVFAEKWPERIERMVWEDTAPIDADFPEGSEEVPGAAPFDFSAATSLVHQIHHPDPSWWNNLPKITSSTLLIGGGSTSYTPRRGWPTLLASSLTAGWRRSRAPGTWSTALAQRSTRSCCGSSLWRAAISRNSPAACRPYEPPPRSYHRRKLFHDCQPHHTRPGGRRDHRHRGSRPSRDAVAGLPSRRRLQRRMLGGGHNIDHHYVGAAFHKEQLDFAKGLVSPTQ